MDTLRAHFTMTFPDAPNVLPIVFAVVPLALMGLGFVAILLPDRLMRSLSGGRDPMSASMLPLSLGLALLGMLLAGVHLHDGIRSLQVDGWDRVPARIQRSDLVEVMQPRSTTPAWRPDVIYEYRYGTQLLQGHRIAFRPLSSSDHAGTQAWLRQHYPIGAQVIARVDPDMPALAVLENGRSFWTWVLAGIGLVLTGTGTHLLRIAMRECRPRPTTRKHAR